MTRAGVIGQPIKHSRSPLIHGYWLKKHGIAGRYDAIEVAPADLQGFLANLAHDGFAGCNVTLPHKEQVARLLHHVDERTRTVGSVNTVVVRDGKLHGTSTDGQGFMANVRAHAPDFEVSGAKAVLLGAGGSARAIVAALLDEGCSVVTIANRTVDKAEAIATVFGTHVHACHLSEVSVKIRDCNLLINTTSAGIVDGMGLELEFKELASNAIVADINYVPLVTPFLMQAEAAGHRIVPGLGMLLHQAVPGFELWFGQRPEVTRELYDLVAADIAGEYR